MGTISSDKRDAYYYRAKQLGYRARSAFKLIDIDGEFGIFENARNAVDLCAAPGSWSQVLERSIHCSDRKIVAVDVQEMPPIGDIIILKDDITSESCLERIKSIFNGESACLVVCDGAPEVTGLHDLDEYLQTDLLKSSLKICCEVGRPGSIFVGKCFRGEYTGFMVRHFLKFYETVDVVKPRSSRDASAECFILARGLRVTDEDPLAMSVDGDAPLDFEMKECGELRIS